MKVMEIGKDNISGARSTMKIKEIVNDNMGAWRNW
jgi:hypothetical protein